MTLSLANLNQIAFSIVGALVASSLFLSAAVGPVPFILSLPSQGSAPKGAGPPPAGTDRTGPPSLPPSNLERRSS